MYNLYISGRRFFVLHSRMENHEEPLSEGLITDVQETTVQSHTPL